MRRNRQKIKDFAERHKVPNYYTDAGMLFNDPRITAIYVATPPNSHKEYAIRALQAGKAVYVEKPMAMNYKECLEMIRVSKETGQPLFVAYYRRALPYFLKVKEWLNNERIGKPLTVDVKLLKTPQLTDFNRDQHTWRINKEIAGEGYFYDLAPHTLDILDFLLGEISEATGYSVNRGGLYRVNDTFATSFQFRSGVVGAGLWGFVHSEHSVRDHVIITGTHGEIRFSTFAFTPLQLFTDAGKESLEVPPPKHIQQPLIQTIVDELRGQGLCPSPGVDAARTSRIMDEILNNH